MQSDIISKEEDVREREGERDSYDDNVKTLD
jgi:hypothetical protein